MSIKGAPSCERAAPGALTRCGRIYGKVRGQSPDAQPPRVVDPAIDERRDPRTDPRYYEIDNWLRQLGVSDERIDEVNREAAEEETAAGRINAGAR